MRWRVIRSVASGIRVCREYLSGLDLFGLEPTQDSGQRPIVPDDRTSERRVSEHLHAQDPQTRRPAGVESNGVAVQPFGPRRCRVLVIDDDEAIRLLLENRLTHEGREVLVASDGKAGLKLFYRERPDITLLDLAMPGMSGLEVLRRIKAYDGHAVVMIFTGCVTEDTIKEARRLGVTDFLQKGEALPVAWDARRRLEHF